MDLSTRLRTADPGLAPWLSSAESLARLLRAVQTTAGPTVVADRIVDWLGGWLPLPCWAVTAQEPAGAVRILASRGLTRPRRPAVLAVARRTLRGRDRFWATADVRRTLGRGPAAAALAFVLFDRTRPVASLVGLDRAAASEAPGCGRLLSRRLAVLLPPLAYALDMSMHLERVQALSVTDELTGLYNARYLRRALAQEVTRAQRTGRSVAVLFGDLDHFKRVNDSYGHLLADQALAEAAELLRASVRDGDVLARFGGDEFAAVLPDTDQASAVRLATRLIERVAEQTFLAEVSRPLRLTISIGIATDRLRPPGGGRPPVASLSAEALLRAADHAMYWVKSRGRNGLYVAAPTAAPTAARVRGEKRR